MGQGVRAKSVGRIQMDRSGHDALKNQAGRILRLRFDDGYEVIAKFLMLDLEHEGTEVMFDPLEVLMEGRGPSTAPGEAILLGSLAELVSWELVDDPSSSSSPSTRADS